MTHVHRDDDGFTLVELLVAMALSLVVLLAVLTSLDLFTKSAGGQTRTTDANAQVRAAMDRAVNDLRGAAVIRSAQASDLVYSVTETTGTRTERLCLSSALLLYRETSTTTTTASSACGSPETGWTVARLSTLPASAASGFTYDGASSSSTPATIKTVGLTFSAVASGNGLSSTSTLRASATLRRAAGTLPLTADDIAETCTSTGALLTLGATAANSLGLGTLSVTYRTAAGVLLGSATGTSGVAIASSATASTIVATITDASGNSTTVQKDGPCG